MEFIKTYAKSLVAVLATVLVAVSSSLSGGITSAEWVGVAIAATGAVAVFAAPNVPGAKYTKSILAVLTAALAFISTTISDGLSGSDWLQVAILGLGAVGVYAFKNTEAGVNISDTGSLGAGGEGENVIL